MELNLHLDKRADNLVAAVAGDDEDLLNTAQTAKLLGVSVQWIETGRSKGYGPPFIRIGARNIRYRRDSLREWLKGRAEYRSTREY
ncbi:DNA-binding protein [Mesorhizobium sp. M7A.F.Ca.US.006.04.2.1]|uniref:helix-turn-helix transcriptional regulator n=1 Tax=unclassified Mesorhizobium TaxID=325217 RepID=UPI000FCBBCAC|nr:MULTISPECIES: helix-turn-helix domain-containing protein [unclassified Mesorhizobium]RUX73890.1 DNA-binding protein [Mesorhizobium sp. M7A.F.Ca.US.005.03.1.1]RUY18454.1 DNA-binding protein [Mesorhizobium sp. M7A.F.Ca.US.005.03.2.1]RVA81613.1 DNA-binding protein [Mesorhizobium sp. M7A.F.Ca.US.006.04.2.1]